MKIYAFKVDEQGLIKERYRIDENEETEYITIQPPDGLYRAKWTGREWVEDMTQEEVDELNNQPTEPTTEERLQMAEDTILFLLMGGM